MNGLPAPEPAEPSGSAATKDGRGEASVRAIRLLRQIILSGELPPGTRVSQTALAQRLGTSRIPVREALLAMEHEGLAEIVANAGAWITGLSVAECNELYQVRERIEPLLLRFNIPHLTAADHDVLDDLAERMKSADPQEFMQLDRAFHTSCYTAASTSMLGDAVLNLWDRTERYRRVYVQSGPSGVDGLVHLDHELLAAAIRRRDETEAEQVLRGHIRRTRLELERHPEYMEKPSKKRRETRRALKGMQ